MAPTNLEPLCRGLFDEDADVRAASAEQLCQLGDDACRAAPALLDACEDADERVRQWASEALGAINTPDEASLPIFALRLASQNGEVLYWAATMLGRLGIAGSTAARALAQLLQRDSAALAARERAAWALGQMGPSASVALESLRSAAQSQHARLSRLAKQAVDAIGDS